jgi:hypothetical protein
MSAGTLTLTNNTDAVTGSGTAFNTELAAGDFIVVTVGGIPYTLPVKTVGSNTTLTLVSKFTGPTQAGAAWYAVPRVAMNLVTAALVTQSAEAMRGLNYDKQNWQQVFSSSGNITVRLPDGSSFTGPSWLYMVNTVATKTNGAVPVSQGGTGGTTPEGARAGLELGSASTLTAAASQTDSTVGRVIRVGDWGLGSTTGVNKNIYADQHVENGFHQAPGSSGSGWFNQFAPMLVLARAGTQCAQIQIVPSTGLAGIRGKEGSTWTPWYTLYTTGNTTKASDGTIKAASPVARVVKSQDECQRADIDEDGFVWCGCGTANAEAEGISISRLDVGVYVLTGSAGLASEGWQLLPPMDPSGMGELGVVEAEQTESGGLTIRLFKRKYMLGDDGEIIKTRGEPIDVPANSWIDVRLDMPENSIWNQRQKDTTEPAS